MKTLHVSAVSLFLIAVAGMPIAAVAIGVSVTPVSLSLTAPAGKESSARFVVRNPSREVGLFEVYPEEFEESLTLIPSRFVLEAMEKREVMLRARFRETGRFHTSVAVEATPLGSPALFVGGGVRLPLSVAVEPSFSLSAGGARANFFIALFALGAVAATFVLLRARRRGFV